MSWVLLAAIGHILNAAAFIVDKTLLSTALKRSGTYAALLSLLSFAAIFFLPWVRVWPQGMMLAVTLGFGGVFVLALWLFFASLKRAETSRVVPIIGSLVPLFTLMGTWHFLGERLSMNQLFGFGMLLLATWLLTSVGDKRGALDGKTLLFATGSAFLFAVSSVLGKASYTAIPFFSAFILSRLGVAGVGLAIIALAPRIRAELFGLFRSQPGKAGTSARTTALAVAGQVCGGIGFLMVHLALSAGSAPIVNALQAIQYAAIFLVAWFGGKRLGAALKENRSRKTMAAKLFALACIALGLILIT